MLRTSLAPLLRRAAGLGGATTTTATTPSTTIAAAGRARALASAAATPSPPKIEADTAAERSIAEVIAANLEGGAERIAVRDTSGGCGAMYTIEVSSPSFSGLSTVKQHQRVTRALGEEVKNWHGFQLVTKASS
jgi:stress-induced morphogen